MSKEKELELRALLQDIAEKKNEQSALATQLIALSKRVKVLDKEVNEKESSFKAREDSLNERENSIKEESGKLLIENKEEKVRLEEEAKSLDERSNALEKQAAGLDGKIKAVEKVMAKAEKIEKESQDAKAAAEEKEAIVAKKEAKVKADRIEILQAKKENAEILKDITEKTKYVDLAKKRDIEASEKQKNIAKGFVIREKDISIKEREAAAKISEIQESKADAESSMKKSIKLKDSAEARIAEAEKVEEKVEQDQLAVDANLKAIDDEKKDLELRKLRLKKIVRDNKLDDEILKGI